jgi:hypothetical protein
MADYYSQFWLKIEELMKEDKTDEVLRWSMKNCRCPIFRWLMKTGCDSWQSLCRKKCQTYVSLR